jgi:Transposase/Phosphotransferase enzyme family
MSKHSSSQQSPRQVKKADRQQGLLTIGMDLGDKHSCYCVLDGRGEVIQEGRVGTNKKAMAKVFGSMGRCRIALEVGTHSPWVSRLLRTLGHEVVVANPRQVKLISASSRKDDRLDAQTLARLVRVDPQLLRPIQHRSAKAQGDLMVIRVRSALVEARTGLINTARGLAKSLGERLPICDSDQMGVEQTESLPAELQRVLEPLLQEVVSLTEKIKEMDRRVEQIAREDYPVTKLLQQVKGVGPLIALTFVGIVGVLDWEMCTVGDPLSDVGTALAYWVDPQDPDELQQICWGPTMVPGSLTRAQLVQRYAQKAGRDVSNMVFYLAFARFKVAVIVQQIYYRYHQGLTKDARFAGLPEVAKILLRASLRTVETGSV